MNETTQHLLGPGQSFLRRDLVVTFSAHDMPTSNCHAACCSRLMLRWCSGPWIILGVVKPFCTRQIDLLYINMSPENACACLTFIFDMGLFPRNVLCCNFVFFLMVHPHEHYRKFIISGCNYTVWLFTHDLFFSLSIPMHAMGIVELTTCMRYVL